MSVSTPPQGTHFSDGVRVGPILGSSFNPGQNVLAPSTVVSSPVDQLSPGIYTTPMSLLDVTPLSVNGSNIAEDFTPGQPGYIPFETTSGNEVTIITYQSIPNVIKLDCARNITITGSAGTVSQDFTIFGWDQYGMPMAEMVTGPVGATLVQGKKAFSYIRAIYVSDATTGAISIGVGNTFGLPFFINYKNYVMTPKWDSNDDESGEILQGDQTIATLTTGDVRGTYTPSTTADGISRLTINLYNASGDIRNYNGANSGPRLIGDNSMTAFNGNSHVQVNAPNHQFIENEMVTISGADTMQGITASQLNITAPVIIIDEDNFFYKTTGVATSDGDGGGPAIFITPGTGILYQTTIGRFGVPQFTMPLF